MTFAKQNTTTSQQVLKTSKLDGEYSASCTSVSASQYLPVVLNQRCNGGMRLFVNGKTGWL